MLPAALLLFAIGATVGTALDGIHTHSGTTLYTNELVWKMAWWTPPVFGLAGLGVGLSYSVVERATGRSVAPAVSFARAVGGFAVFVLLYFASGYLPASNGVKLLVLLSGAALLLYANARSPMAVVLALVTGCIGPLVEITLVSLGTFRHLQPDVLGIPIWLPALYASGSVAFGVLGSTITRSLDT
jgi:hypothetical protein